MKTTQTMIKNGVENGHPLKAKVVHDL
jgi:hypothetical protein